jgi:hypothetical protein
MILKRAGVLGLVTLLTITSLAAAAEEQAVKFGLSADYYSKYIWRGQNLNDESVLQPAVSVSAYGFTGSIWGNMDLTNGSQSAPDNAGEFSEFDWSLDYTAAVPGIENLNFSVGTIYYRFPNQVFHPTTEVYAGLSLSDGLLSPSIKLYHDIDEIDGSYLQLGVGHTFEKIYEVNDKCYCGFQLGANIGWGSSGYNHGYFGVDNSKFNDLTLTAGLPFCIGSWTLRPSVNYASMLSDDIRQGREDNDNVWWGIGLSTSF